MSQNCYLSLSQSYQGIHVVLLVERFTIRCEGLNSVGRDWKVDDNVNEVATLFMIIYIRTGKKYVKRKAYAIINPYVLCDNTTVVSDS